MSQIPKLLGPAIRRLGFKGAGQTYRRVEDDNVFVINIQLSRARNVFYINLGVQPTFIPALGGADLATLKEYACVMRTRVGRDWPLDLDEEGVPPLVREIDDKQRDFFGRARTLRQSLATDSPAELLSKFCAGTLRLAEAAVTLGHGATASALVEHGLANAPEDAGILRAELKRMQTAMATGGRMAESVSECQT